MYHWTCVGTTTTVELNPVEAVWSHLKRSLADLAGYFGSSAINCRRFLPLAWCVQLALLLTWVCTYAESADDGPRNARPSGSSVQPSSAMTASTSAHFACVHG